MKAFNVTGPIPAVHKRTREYRSKVDVNQSKVTALQKTKHRDLPLDLQRSKVVLQECNSINDIDSRQSPALNIVKQIEM